MNNDIFHFNIRRPQILKARGVLKKRPSVSVGGPRWHSKFSLLPMLLAPKSNFLSLTQQTQEQQLFGPSIRSPLRQHQNSVFEEH